MILREISLALCLVLLIGTACVSIADSLDARRPESDLIEIVHSENQDSSVAAADSLGFSESHSSLLLTTGLVIGTFGSLIAFFFVRSK